MYRQLIPLVCGVSILGCILGGCKKESEEKIEDVAVMDIPVSKPPEVKVIKQEQENFWDYDGVWKVSKDVKYYNAVVPEGAVLLATNERETRFYVKKMESREAKKFIAKYFPYQIMKNFPAVDLIELYTTHDPKYEDGSVVVDLNPNIIKPEPGKEVAITVYWDSHDKMYEWIYHDPDYLPPEHEIGHDEVDTKVSEKENIE